MAAKLIDVQLKISGGNKSPLVTGDRRLTLSNLAYLLRGLNHGSEYGQGDNYVQVTTFVAASATATPASVVNGNTISIAGTALTAAQKRATGTATCATVLAGTTVTVNGVVFTGVAGAVTLGDATFSVDTGNTETATSIAAQVNAYASPLLSGIVAAKSASAVVTFYAVTQGTAGNSITLASSDGGTLAVSGATLANGAALSNNTFDFAGTNATTGAALAAAITASTTAAVQQVTAEASAAGVVTITAKMGGVAGNAITLTSVGGTITVTGGGVLAGGSQAAVTRWTL